MNRRHFIHRSLGAVVVALAPLSLARSVRATPAVAPSSYFRLVRVVDGLLLPLRVCAAQECAASELVVRFRSFSPAAGGALEALRVHALHEARNGHRRPHLVWSHTAGNPTGGSGGVRIGAGRETLRALRLDYRLGALEASEECALTVPGRDGLEPGKYLLIGPDAAGRRASVAQLVAGDLGRFDVLEFDVGLPA